LTNQDDTGIILSPQKYFCEMETRVFGAILDHFYLPEAEYPTATVLDTLMIASHISAYIGIKRQEIDARLLHECLYSR